MVSTLGLLVIVSHIPIIPVLIKSDSHPSIFNNAFSAFNFPGVRFFSNNSPLKKFSTAKPLLWLLGFISA